MTAARRSLLPVASAAVAVLVAGLAVFGLRQHHGGSGRAVRLAAAGRSLPVPRFRQAAASQGVLPNAVGPLELSPSDEWDRRLLGGVLELDRQLVNFGDGFEAQLPPGSGVTPGFYQLLIPPLA